MTKEQLIALNKTNPILLARLDASGRKKYHAKGIKGQGIKIGLVGDSSGSHEQIVKSFLNDSIVGQAPKAEVFLYDCGSEVHLYEIASAIRKGVKDGMHFMSISYSHYYNLHELEEAINYAFENNCIVYSSVGNTGNEKKRYPAAYEKCFGVGSLGNNHITSNFSAYGSKTFCSYYGEYMVGCNKGIYSIYSGTSFAQPIV